MAFLSGFNVSLAQVDVLGRASLAAFSGAPVPSGWTVVTPASLGLGSQHRDGNYYKDGDTGASAIVLRKGNEYIVSFRGTDDQRDIDSYPELYFGTYIDHFRPLLSALKAEAPAGAKFSFTGVSLGGGAVNNLASIAQNDFGGTFKKSAFVAFASPNITNASGILNLGVENDPVYKSVPNPYWAAKFQDYASSADNIVLANNAYVAGSGGQDNSAHNGLEYLTMFERLAKSAYQTDMSIDSVIVVAASNGLIQDKGAGRENTGAFYIGRDNASDRMTGRNGNDTMEGFGGADTLNGGRGNDRIDGGIGNDVINGGIGNDTVKGGDGNDTIVIAGSEARLDVMSGGAGTDTLKASGSSVTLAGFNAATASIEKWQGSGVTVLGDSANNAFDFRTLTSVSGLVAVDGGAGNDKLYGSRFADTLRGGGGNDTLLGSGGNDILSGGSGVDTFVFSVRFGHDRITDFAVNGTAQDVIRFGSSLFSDFADVKAHAAQVGSAVVITVDASNSLTLDKVTLASLSANDFAFV
jgi:Ca2+-binding RTX toxin-like protein